MPERLGPDVQLLKRESSDYVAQSIVIATAEEYAASAERLKAGKAFVDKVTQSFKPILDKIHDSLNSARDLRDSITTPVESHRKLIEQARYDYEARVKAEQAAANARALKLAEEAAQADREQLAAMGLEDMITADPLLPAPMPIALPKSPGISGRKQWSAEVTDEAALFMAVASGKAPRECLMVNQVFLNSLAKAAKTTLNIPGVKAVFRPVTSVRA